MEAGVRGLKNEMDILCRTAAVELVRKTGDTLHVTEENLEKYLGRNKLHLEKRLTQGDPGVVTGLAWTRAGGEILFIESKLVNGKGGLMITGQLGDVMKESVQIALSIVKALYPEETKVLEEKTLHIHVPAEPFPRTDPRPGLLW